MVSRCSKAKSMVLARLSLVPADMKSLPAARFVGARRRDVKRRWTALPTKLEPFLHGTHCKRCEQRACNDHDGNRARRRRVLLAGHLQVGVLDTRLCDRLWRLELATRRRTYAANLSA